MDNTRIVEKYSKKWMDEMIDKFVRKIPAGATDNEVRALKIKVEYALLKEIREGGRLR